MNLEITPSLPVGDITAPPSKSFAHRALICAGLSDGVSIISNISFSEDIKATIECLESLGAKIEINGNTAKIEGINGIYNSDGAVLNCNESGSTMRFFIPICLLFNKNIKLCGTEKLISRPLGVYEEIANEQGIEFKKNSDSVMLKGRLKSGKYTVNGNISSQFISGLLFALPLLTGDSEIEIIPPFESKPYVTMTIDILKSFGIVIEDNGLNFKIKGGQNYKATDLTVEGDWSNAAFLYAFKEIGANVNVLGVDINSSQGDKICLEYFSKLKNGVPTLDLTDCPDLAPVMFAFAGLYNGAVFTGTDRLRYKESDRISCMQEELNKYGINLSVGENEVTVGSDVFHSPDSEIFGHNDHRIVMANAILLCKTGGKISGYEAVTKSYPDFFGVISKAGVNISYET